MAASSLSHRLPALRRSLRRHRRILVLLAITVICAQALLAAAVRFAPAPTADASTPPPGAAPLQLGETEAAVAIPVPNEAFAALLTAGTDVEVVCGSESGTVTRVPGRVAELPAAGGSSGSGTPFAAGSAPSVVIVMEHTDVSDALHCSQQIWSSVVVVH